MNIRVPITIDGFADETTFPGVVNFYLKDYAGRKIHFVNNTSIVTKLNISAAHSFPIKDLIPCEMIRTWKDETRMKLVEVNTNAPCGIQDINGNTIFIISEKPFT